MALDDCPRHSFLVRTNAGCAACLTEALIEAHARANVAEAKLATVERMMEAFLGEWASGQKAMREAAVMLRAVLAANPALPGFAVLEKLDELTGENR